MKKTAWFKGHTKPVHLGVYETKNPVALSRVVYQHWDGHMWGKYMPSPLSAWKLREEPSSYQDQPWRGLAKKPS